MRSKFTDSLGVARVLDLIGLGGDNDPNNNPIGAVAIKPSAGLSGVEKIYAMIASIDGATPSGSADIFDNANGVKAFNVALDPSVALPATTDFIVVAYSTVATDANALTNAQNFVTEAEAGGTRTGQAYYNIVVLTADYPAATIEYDGVNTIKRIVAINTSAAELHYLLTTVE